jgi:hypothetical protein
MLASVAPLKHRCHSDRAVYNEIFHQTNMAQNKNNPLEGLVWYPFQDLTLVSIGKNWIKYTNRCYRGQ